MLDSRPYPAATLDRLVEAIDVNDLVDRAALRPDAVDLDYSPERFVEGFRLSRQLWQEGFDRDRLVALAADLRRGGTFDENGRAALKAVRARFKHLRFAFFLYSAAHRSPAMLSLVTLIMGELQDAVRVKGHRAIRRRALQLQLMLATPGERLLRHEADRLAPSDAAGFRRFTLAQIASLRPLLTTPTVTAHDFHAARKVVSRQVSFHDDMRTLYDGDEHLVMARWLATLNGLMGQAHDDLVAAHAMGTFDYGRQSFALPGEIGDRIAALIDLYFGTSSS